MAHSEDIADLEQSKNAVLHSLGTESSLESYGHAIEAGRIATNRVFHSTELSFFVPVLSQTEEPGAAHHLKIYSGDPAFATSVVCPILATGTEALERLTGKWPGIGISPKSAFAALISETVAFENVQM